MIRNKPRRDVGASGGMRSFDDGRLLRLAQKTHGWHEPTSAELKRARHMAQDGASWTELHEALGWDCHIITTMKRLRKFNIFSRTGCNANDKLAKFGGRTTLKGDPDMRAYKPREIIR